MPPAGYHTFPGAMRQTERAVGEEGEGREGTRVLELSRVKSKGEKGNRIRVRALENNMTIKENSVHIRV